MKNMNILITGGAGFIGSNLAIKLANDNNVIIIDDLSRGKMKNIVSMTKNKNVKFIPGSILNRNLLKQNLYGVDLVFHLAAITSVSRSIDDPLLTNEVNVTGTLNVLTAAKNSNVKKVIFSSSSSVYGDSPTLPKVEDMATNPNSPYAVTKLIGEHYCRIFNDIYQLPTVSLGYFNIYGPRQDSKSDYAAVIPRFIDKLAQNQSPIINGDGKQTRDFTFVEDAIQANIIAASSDITGILNVGTGKNISIYGLAEKLIEIMNKDIKPIYKDARLGDVRDSLADITKANAIGYKPKYSLNDGLKKTLKWFENEN